MSPLLDVQQRIREIGRLRIGARTKTKSGKTVPTKLSEFRVTSPSRAIVQAVADIYGGAVQEWEGAPTDGDQWECYTQADEIRIILPPNEFVSQWWELWSGGGCQRRCDGQTEMLSMKPCLCDPDPAERECKPTTRLRVMLPEVAAVGVFRLETHGYYAAVELAGVAQLLAAATATGKALPATLRLEQRERRVPGKPTRHFAVPVIDVLAPIGALLESVGAFQELDAPSAPAQLAPAPTNGRRGTQREPLPAPPGLPDARGRPAEPEIPPGPPPPPPAGFDPPADDDSPDVDASPPPRRERAATGPAPWAMSEKQRGRLHALRGEDLTHDELKAGIARWWQIASTNDLSEAQYEALTRTLEDPGLRERFVSYAVDAYAAEQEGAE